ncbi:hypothetical protein BFW38_05700 [Terasakiispira papahanaumokuakeensis]|uniref:DUF2345 domain-containing protein n=1 Tax=Terasakiispira papahanaumokuakeensis TaxID=197479 RepID=A0A1E2V818_9GAMM|nr:type VI secretion system Vgr family protein [Terasakiispira papahanaumokuakeensis]ODC03114.1 hypothetical protein BFW38_05700 [Terasakiispira papahanaumokuakeensis]
MPPVHSYVDGNIITDDVDTCTPVSPQQIRFHRQDATETEDTITQWRGVRRLQPKRVTVGSFDYKQPPLEKRTTLDTQDDQGNLPETELYDYAGEYYYHEFDRGERLVDNRLEAHESRAKRFYGAGGIRHLSTGAWFELTQHSRHDTGGGEEREFLILGLSIHAENSLPMTAQLKPMPGSLQTEIQAAKEAHGLTQEDPENDTDEAQADAYRTGGTGHFLIDFEAQRRTHAFRNPLRHPRPVVSGPQTAIIVGPEGEEVYSDHLNRVKAHFHWDRQGQRNDHDSCWLRVAQNNAGTQWGGVFTPRIGQEVLVDFLEGDVDRPLITGRIYNGEQTPEWHSNGLFSGFKSKTYRGGLFNELVLDDATDQERIKLNSEQKKTQLNLGYLIHQQGNFRGAFRGTGFDLRTDAYGSVRANKGLYLTSFGQPEAAGEQLELDPVKTQLDAAYELKNSLSNSATAHNAEALTAKDNLKTASDHTTPTYGRSGGGGDQTSAQGATDGGGKGQVKGLDAPWLHLASPAGITLSTPESLHFAQTHDFSATTGQDMNFSQGKNWVAAAREKLSLFVEKAGIKLFAGKQKVEIQAQSDNLELTSKQDNTTTSTESNIDLAAAEEVLLVSGGAYVRIKGGNIELHAPGKVEFFGAMKSFTGPTQQAYELPPLPDTENTQLKLHHTYGNDEPVALAQYQATFPDGSTRTGQLDNQGKATLDGVPPGCAFVDYHTQPDPINPEGKPWNKPKEGPPDISMLSQPSSSQPEEEEETLSTAEQLKQKAGQYNQRATDLREQLNNNPDGKSHEEALALQDQVTQLNADTQQLREDLNEAARSGEITGSDLTDALYDVDDAANRANNLRPEAARQVQYASPNGQQAREVAELVVPGFGTLTDAKDIAQLLSTGQYGAAAGMTGLAIASIFPLARAARKVGRTSDAAEDVASAAKRVDEVPSSSRVVTASNRAELEQQLISRLGSDIKNNPLRQEYEAKVAELAKYQQGLTDHSIRDKAVANMANLPGSEKALAERANNARRQLGVEYKNLTPEPLRDYIYDVNLKRYGDPLGPNVDVLAQRGKTYSQIVESASRPNPDVNKLLDGFGKWLSKQPDDYIQKHIHLLDGIN